MPHSSIERHRRSRNVRIYPDTRGTSLGLSLAMLARRARSAQTHPLASQLQQVISTSCECPSFVELVTVTLEDASVAKSSALSVTVWVCVAVPLMS